ncbi:hypothetical protein DL93DRAFT_2151979 [Clavulina sp. PMI_390]|nr:hypothetical protein DL93DRAFT_2151979 [Clavulina sp. PMI_390]
MARSFFALPLLWLSFATVSLAGVVQPSSASPQLPLEAIQEAAVGYDVPADYGGSQLDSSAGLGEPLNIIISALSSPEVLTNKGLENWARSIAFSTECLGFHLGNPQTANLGDGLGWQNETAVLRFDYDNAITGSCLESFTGGNHFRFWKQATTGAYFLAASIEEWIGEHHNIIPNGYDKGRDVIVITATGHTKYMMNEYLTASYYVTGLLKPGTEGINHNISIDGRVAVLTIAKIA